MNTAVSLTSNLYWSMVESGIGLIAVCLPTYRLLFSQFSMKVLLNSVRSAFLLRSQTFQFSRAAQVIELPNKKHRERKRSAVFSARDAYPQTTTCELTTSNENLDSVEDSRSTDDAIHVKNTFIYREDIV